MSDVRNWMYFLELRGSREFNKSDPFSRRCVPVAKLNSGYSLYCWYKKKYRKLVFHYFLAISKSYSFIFSISTFNYIPGFDSRQEQEIFIFFTASRPAVGPTQAPIQWVQGVLSREQSGWNVKLTTHLHLVPSSGMVELYFHSPIRLHGMVLN
jgi:hypothetical protein